MSYSSHSFTALDTRIITGYLTGLVMTKQAYLLCLNFYTVTLIRLGFRHVGISARATKITVSTQRSCLLIDLAVDPPRFFWTTPLQSWSP